MLGRLSSVAEGFGDGAHCICSCWSQCQRSCEAHRASSSRGRIVCTCDDAHHTSSRRASGPLSSASWCLALDRVGVAIVHNSDDSGRTHLKCLPNQRRQFQPCAQWHFAGDHRSDGLSGDVGDLSVNATPHQLPLWSTLLSCVRRHSLYQRWQCQCNSSLFLLGPSTCASVGSYHRQLWVMQFRSCSLCCASSRIGVLSLRLR